MIWQGILIVFLLILLNGFFALSELAVVSSRKGRLQQYAEEGRSGAEAALRLAEDPTGFLSAVQVGITLIAILSGAYGEAALAVPLAGISGTVLLYRHPCQYDIFGNRHRLDHLHIPDGRRACPKRLALRNPERLACIVAPTMRFISRVTLPIIWFLRQCTELLLRLFTPPAAEDPRVTEEEVKTLIAEGTEAGIFDPAEKEMLEGVLRIADRTVRSIMVPRPDVVWIDLDETMEEAYQIIAESGHSRFPIAQDDVDNVIGVVHAKDLLEMSRTGKTIDLKSIARDPIYIHESTPVLKLLEGFRASAVHMAVVLDEHGTLQGIVTPTDILIGIAGDLPEREGDDEPSAVMRGDGSWLLDGQMPVYDVERKLEIKGMSSHDDEYTTIAGFVLTQLGHIPVPGETFDWHSWRFEVLDLDGRRIDKVLISVRAESNA